MIAQVPFLSPIAGASLEIATPGTPSYALRLIITHKKVPHSNILRRDKNFFLSSRPAGRSRHPKEVLSAGNLIAAYWYSTQFFRVLRCCFPNDLADLFTHLLYRVHRPDTVQVFIVGNDLSMNDVGERLSPVIETPQQSFPIYEIVVPTNPKGERRSS